MNQLHFLQREILRKLLFTDVARFSDLETENIESNLVNFHINQLIKDGLVTKTKDKKYKLSDFGKEYANRMDDEKKLIERQGKISCILCCVRKIDSQDPELLIYTRKKHPFYNSQGYSSGKVKFGESIEETAVRELLEETNLTTSEKPQLFMIEHHRVFEKGSEKLLEDKYFNFCRIIDPVGNLKPNEEGLFEWIKFSKVEKYFTKPFESVDRLMYITNRVLDLDSNLTFEEISHFADNF